MRQVITTEKHPIKLWLEDVEEGALQQAKNLANLPFLKGWVALMPDAHQGYGMPIGGVVALEGVVIPNAVGVDIGCGMCAVRSDQRFLEQETLKRVMGRVREEIPVGFNHHKMKQFDVLPIDSEVGDLRVAKAEYQSALYQVGTLGGGNHFIEFQQGSDGFVWVMVHSGSRNLGKKVADYYNGVAKEVNEKYQIAVPREWDLAFLPIDSNEGQEYLKEMQFCVGFAVVSRHLMVSKIERILEEEVGAALGAVINIAHNYAVMEKHMGKEVLVHRKGATKASVGLVGVIPGSQGTKSYIVQGKGNQESFNSCSHGAGRKMGRKAAQRTLDFLDEVRKLDEMGVVHSIRSSKDLDEAPGAYKDISEVMRNQEDLVEVLVELTPLGVIKG